MPWNIKNYKNIIFLPVFTITHPDISILFTLDDRVENSESRHRRRVFCFKEDSLVTLFSSLRSEGGSKKGRVVRCGSKKWAQKSHKSATIEHERTLEPRSLSRRDKKRKVKNANKKPIWYFPMFTFMFMLMFFFLLNNASILPNVNKTFSKEEQQNWVWKWGALVLLLTWSLQM